MYEKLKHHKLIVTIVKKGWARKVVKASKEAGAEGGTVLFAKGTGVHEIKSFLGIDIEQEKEVILTLVPEDRLEEVLTGIEKTGKLDMPGNGIGFVLNTKNIAGICHLLGQKPSGIL